MANFNKFGQTGVASTIQLGKGGAKVKNNSGVIEARNAADSALAVVRAADPVGANDVVTKQYLLAQGNVTVVGNIYDSGSTTPASTQFTSAAQEGKIAICNQSVGTFVNKRLYRLDTWNTDVATSTWTEITPTEGFRFVNGVASSGGTTVYAADHIYVYDAQGAEWVDIGPAAAVTNVTKNFKQTLAFGASSPVVIGTPADNSVIARIAVVVTTPFNGTAPTLDIGVSGTTDKYMDQDEIDLKTAGVYISEPFTFEATGLEIIATYAADSSSAGAARITVEYDI